MSHAERIAAIRLRVQRAIGGIEMGPNNPTEAMIYDKMRLAGSSEVEPLLEVLWLCDFASGFCGTTPE